MTPSPGHTDHLYNNTSGTMILVAQPMTEVEIIAMLRTVYGCGGVHGVAKLLRGRSGVYAVGPHVGGAASGREVRRDYRSIATLGGAEGSLCV